MTETYDATALQRELSALRLANDALVTECGACQTALREEEKEVARLRALVGELEDAAVWSDKRFAQLSDEEKQLAQALATERAASEFRLKEWQAAEQRAATERAARENAEIYRNKFEAALQLANKTVDRRTARAEQAERERDTALARVKELEAKGAHDVSVMQDLLDIASSDLDSARREKWAAETALASALSLLSTAALKVDWQGWHDDYQALLTSHPSPAPVAATCAGCAALQVDLAFAKSQRDDNENAWQAEKAKRLAREMDIALLQRRLRFRNEAIAFLTKSKLTFDESGTPQGATDLLYFTWWQQMRKQVWELRYQLQLRDRRLAADERCIDHYRASLLRTGQRLHVKRAEAAHWQDKAGWEDVAKDQALRDGREIVGLRIDCDNLKFRLQMAEDNNPDSVLSKHNAMMMAIEQRDVCKRTAEKAMADMQADMEACHRQHEQCMKLLARIQALLLDRNAQTAWKIRNVQDLLREMLTKGELPEGWDQ